MDITLGLDFGTHQSKLCLSYMPNNEQIYEFLDFVKPDGTKTFLFPSIIQINKDDTISIGFVDRSNCKASSTPAPAEPVFPAEPDQTLPPRPKKVYPDKPKEEKLDWKEQLTALSKGRSKYQEQLEKWEKRCKEIDAKWESDYYKWLDACDEIQDAHKDWDLYEEIEKIEKKCSCISKNHFITSNRWKTVEKIALGYKNFKYNTCDCKNETMKKIRDVIREKYPDMIAK